MLPYVISVGIDSSLHEWARANGFSFSSKPDDICIYRGNNQLGLSDAQDEWLRSRCFERLFEYCYLPHHVKGQARAFLVQTLFSEIDTKYYTKAINLSINIECYNTLFQGALSRINSNTTHILDVGCGPGTILNSIPAQQATSITGFDFVEANCVEARRRGLSVVNAIGLAAIPADSIDILLFTYVLHFETLSEEDMVQLIRVLRRDGIWAANFHKSKGLAWFKDMLQSRDSFTFDQIPSYFGQLLFARIGE